MPSIHIKSTHKKLSSPLPPSKTIIKYKDLLEGIGHQVLNKIVQAGNTNNHNYNFFTSSHNTMINPRFKQITGAITLLYTLIIFIICFGMLIIYLLFPEESNLIRKMMLTALPFMVVFTFSILLCYLYLNRFNLTGSSNSNNAGFFSHLCGSKISQCSHLVSQCTQVTYSDNNISGFTPTNFVNNSYSNLYETQSRNNLKSSGGYLSSSTNSSQYSTSRGNNLATTTNTQPTKIKHNSDNSNELNSMSRTSSHEYGASSGLSSGMSSHHSNKMNNVNLMTTAKQIASRSHTYIQPNNLNNINSNSFVNSQYQNQNSNYHHSNNTYGSTFDDSFDRSFDDHAYRSNLPYNPNSRLVSVPNWEQPDFTDLEDSHRINFEENRHKQEKLSSTLEFLKYKD